jgi:hypothetical protein
MRGNANFLIEGAAFLAVDAGGCSVFDEIRATARGKAAGWKFCFDALPSRNRLTLAHPFARGRPRPAGVQPLNAIAALDWSTPPMR